MTKGFVIVHNDKVVAISNSATLEQIKLANVAAKNHGYSTIICFPNDMEVIRPRMSENTMDMILDPDLKGSW